MGVRVEVRPEMLGWAIERSGRPEEELRNNAKFKFLDAWQSGEKLPTLVQLQDFANATYTPVGFLMLDAPPTEDLPIPDYRTVESSGVSTPSPHLLETIYLCQQRQAWYQEWAEGHLNADLDFVKSATTDDDPIQIADQIRERLGFDLETRLRHRTWVEALRGLIESAEEIGILVMVSGIVGNNTHRALNPSEFRGFTLVDDRAPLIFVNGADTKAAQIFTLAHELAHVWLGLTGVSNVELDHDEDPEVERWCNSVAAELLLPIGSLPSALNGPTLTHDLERLARRYKVSTLVVLRRLADAGLITWREFHAAFEPERDRVVELMTQSGGGGNFYYTQPYRVSRRFAVAVITDTLEGETLHRDAFRLLGVRKYKTFEELGEYVGVS